MTRTRTTRRPGKILVLFAFVVTALLGLLGLVVDGGVLQASHRRVQNAADAAALAAAMDLMRGYDSATATTTATTFVQTYNGLSGATVTVNIPPTTGPHAGMPGYAEVTVTWTVSTVFAQAVGAGSSQQLAARAVAGYEPISSGEGAIVLDPTAASGLAFSGTNTRLKVAGSVIINSQSNGYDQYGSAVPSGMSPSNPFAITTSNNAVSDPTQAYILARSVQVAGGADTPANIRDYDDPTNNASPLYAGMSVSPDPLRTLPVPTQSNVPSITDWTRKSSMNIGTGQTVTLTPGVYEDIRITGGTVTFSPGVYILSPTGNNQGLRISGGTVTGTGVMFYFTGSNYLDTSPGYWDALDGAYDGPLPPTNGTLPSDPYTGKVNYASLSVGGSSGSVTLEGMAYATDDPDDKILFFQRRRNTSAAQFGGGGSGNMETSLSGTIYAKWAQFTLNGGRTYDAQFIVGSLTLGGGATMTIRGTGINRGRANQVFLVE